MVNIITLSKILILFFVGSVTLWYLVTPYLVTPHPDIVEHILTRTKLLAEESVVKSKDGKVVTIYNWTKWPINVNASKDSVASTVHPRSSRSVEYSEEMFMNMPWRSEYVIHASSKLPTSRNLEVEIQTPAFSASGWGIYNHFVASAEEASITIVPRFLFGLPFTVIEDLYGTDVSKFPIIGVFTSSTKKDRWIIQAYMSIVTTSVCFLLYANNPPHELRAKQAASQSKSRSSQQEEEEQSQSQGIKAAE